MRQSESSSTAGFRDPTRTQSSMETASLGWGVQRAGEGVVPRLQAHTVPSERLAAEGPDPTGKVRLVTFCTSFGRPPSWLPGFTSKSTARALARAGLAGHPLLHQEVASLIPVKGTCPGCGLDPQEGAYRRQPIGVTMLSN
uniref:Uncharacterized protein n=1 Tax=Myotis myotis TaxID=51298 RepID=A0A7J7R1T5_MYOMY|nr:hypothetical protein mMyoMyo1_011212 [Myotis myotis]